MPYFVPWKLGTPLPTVPAGSTVEAMPSQASMKGIQPRTPLHMTPVTLPTAATPAAAASAATAATTALASDANSAGYVNLEVIPYDIVGCGPVTHNYDEGQEVDAVAQSYSTDAYDTQSITYTKGASSSIEVGFSTTNAYGTFSGDGTVSDSTTGAVDMPSQYGKVNNYWRTFWEWADFTQVCKPNITYYYNYPYQWIVASDSVYQPAHVGSYNSSACGNEDKGTTIRINTTTASTIGGAFNVEGFAGSTQTGYTSSTDININFGEHGYNCGTQLWPHQGFGFPVAIP